MRKPWAKSPSATCSSPEGFTLLEVLVAVSILALAASTLLVIRNNATQQSFEAFNLRVATQLASTKMQQMLLADDPMTAVGRGEFPQHPRYKWESTVTEMSIGKDIPLLSDVPVKQVTLTVTYPVARGETKSFKWVSLVPPPVELVIEDMAEEDIPDDMLNALEKAGIPFPERK